MHKFKCLWTGLFAKLDTYFMTRWANAKRWTLLTLCYWSRSYFSSLSCDQMEFFFYVIITKCLFQIAAGSCKRCESFVDDFQNIIFNNNEIMVRTITWRSVISWLKFIYRVPYSFVCICSESAARFELAGYKYQALLAAVVMVPLQCWNIIFHKKQKRISALKSRLWSHSKRKSIGYFCHLLHLHSCRLANDKIRCYIHRICANLKANWDCQNSVQRFTNTIAPISPLVISPRDHC